MVRCQDVRLPDIFLNGRVLQWHTDQKYLGVHINEYLCDDKDISRQMKAVYSKGNTLIRKFNNCSQDVKVQLFQSYCTSLYCSSLWSQFKSSTFKQLNVAYNKTFKYLLSVKGKCSVSQLFLDHKVDCFKVLYRKLATGFIDRLFKCDNLLVHTMTSSTYFLLQSKLHKDWIILCYNF